MVRKIKYTEIYVRDSEVTGCKSRPSLNRRKK